MFSGGLNTSCWKVAPRRVWKGSVLFCVHLDWENGLGKICIPALLQRKKVPVPILVHFTLVRVLY